LWFQRANGVVHLPPGLAGRQNHDSTKNWQMTVTEGAELDAHVGLRHRTYASELDLLMLSMVS
jgi:hypothetical protein